MKLPPCEAEDCAELLTSRGLRIVRAPFLLAGSHRQYAKSCLELKGGDSAELSKVGERWPCRCRFEVTVVERVVLDLHCQAPICRIERGSFDNRPGFEDLVHPQTQVVT